MKKVWLYVKYYVINLLNSIDYMVNAIVGGSPDQGLTVRFGLRSEVQDAGFIERAKRAMGN